MSKIARVEQKVFGDNAPSGEVGQIGSLAAGSPATTKDLATIQALTEYLGGLFDITGSGNEPPRIEDINGLYFLLTSQLRYLFQSGVAAWQTDSEYYADESVVMGSDGTLYIAVTGSVPSPNVGNDPTSNPTDWTPLVSKDGAIRSAIEYGKKLGELYWLDDFVAPGIWAAATPDTYHPGLCLSTIDGFEDITTANWALLVPHLRAIPLIYLKGKTGESSSFDVTDWAISSNVAKLTFANTAAENAVLAALAEDQLVHGSYSDWRTVTLAGSIGDITAGDYAITDVDTVARTIDFAFTAGDNSGSGSFTVAFFPHRIVSAGTSARVFEINGRTMVSAGDSDGEAFAGLLRRDRLQGHKHTVGDESGGAGSSVGFDRKVGGAIFAKIPDLIGNTPVTDGTNGTPRTGLTTDPRALIGHLYLHGRSYSV